LIADRPWVTGLRPSEAPILKKSLARDGGAEEHTHRARAARNWFESWLGRPMAKRSTGCSALPAGYFTSTAAFIARALELDSRADLVLDVGCDSAMVSRLVAPHCHRLTGVDFISGMLTEASRERLDRNLGLAAADGRRLPFASGTFTKVYCAGVIHMLPSVDDGLRVIDELTRVCRSGGTVLVAAVPDERKRSVALHDAWEASGTVGKLRILCSRAIPQPVKKMLRQLLGMRQNEPASLSYDLKEIKRRLRIRNLECKLMDFPESYWSRDFQRTRSNLIIRVKSQTDTVN
jgi:ubiquinone/menaquinone biosynthesis C-methylase UbiE